MTLRRRTDKSTCERRQAVHDRLPPAPWKKAFRPVVYENRYVFENGVWKISELSYNSQPVVERKIGRAHV